MERALDELPLSIHFAAVDFVTHPIASLTLCIAICCVLTSSAILHRSGASKVATIACTQHVLRLDKDLTTSSSCNLFIINKQQNAISSGVFIEKTIDAGKFSIVCGIAQPLKTHEVVKLESDHCNVEM
jgi:hypothetical protein